jgi:hypothetical protein
MKRLFTILILVACMIGSRDIFAQNDTYRSMQQGFKNPPVSSHPAVYHWWLGGNVDTLRLREELKALKAGGVSGFTIFEIGSRDTVLVKAGPAYLGQESLKIIKFAVNEAKKLGMEIGLNTASSWNAGGNWIPPKYAAKSIYHSKTALTGGKTIRVKLPFPEISEKDAWNKRRLIEFRKDGKPAFYEEIAVLALPAKTVIAGLDTGRVINITRFFNPETETLKWDAPAGEWEIFRYVCSNSGENLVLPSKHSAGPIMDHFDAEATEFHFEYIINKLESVLGDLKKSPLKSLYMASYEAKGFTWTTTLPEVFREINGYEADKFLPALFSGDLFTPEITANFKADFQRTLSELMIQNFYKKSREVCNRHGLKNNSEAGGPGLPLHNVPVEPLKALGALDIPRGEYWINHGRFNKEGIDILRVIKEVSAASHIYNRGIVEMEAFTSFQHWQEGPFEMKPVGDRAFCEGMNKVVIHGSTHNPEGTGFPGIVYHAGTHYNDKRVWWPKIRPFNEYLSRISFVLQEGDFFADVLFYYGDTIPNYGGHKNSRFSPGPGYEYEMINTEILKELTVINGKLVLPGGARFSLLALSKEFEINPEVLLKLDELARQGAIIIGEKPQRVAVRKIQTGMPDMKNLLNELWADFNNAGLQKGKAKVYSGIEPSDMLAHLQIEPDLSYSDMDLYTLDYTHYTKDDLSFYFIRNTTNEWISRNLSFRQQNKIPEIWEPVSGEIIPVPIFSREDKHITLPVSLAPYGSTFVVFGNGSFTPHYEQVQGDQLHPPILQYTKEGVCFWEDGIFKLTGRNEAEVIHTLMDVKTLEGAWEVFFPENWGAPDRSVFPELISWTESEQEGIKYFSGIARYEKSFVHGINSHALDNPKIYIDLGDLAHVGEVWLNGQSLGITWTKPYRFDITSVLKPGENKLVIEIANTWANRIVGDALTGEKFTRSNITVTDIDKGYFIRVPWNEVPLVKSGLFGPVTITTIQPVN